MVWLFALAICLTAAELLLRTVAPQYGTLYFSLTRTGGHPITYNRHGFRDPERPLQKVPGTIRLLALGDSVTWGYGVADDQLYIRFVERFWNHGRHPRRLEIWNMAGMGRSARVYLPHVRRLLAFRPDGVIIQINLNDVGDVRKKLPPREDLARWETPAQEQARKRKNEISWGQLLADPSLLLSYVRLWLTRTHLGAFLIVQMTRLSYGLGLRKKDPLGRNRYEFLAFQDHAQARGAWVDYALDLIQLTTAFRLAGVKVLWVVIPYRYQVEGPGNLWGIDPRGFPVDPQAMIAFLADFLGVPVLDLGPVFVRERKLMAAGRKRYRRLYLLLDANHLDRYGHALAGRAIYDFIVRRRWLTVDR